MKFAHVLNVTSCLLIVLIPFGTTYIGYIVGVISSAFNKAGIRQSAYAMYIKSIPFNLYAIVMLLISIGIIVFGLKFEEKAPPRPLNLIIPLALLIMTTFFLFWYTGKGKGSGFINAIMNAEFEKSILMSGIITLVITSVFYVIQKIPMKEIESHFLIGGNDLIPPIIILILSWGLSSIVEDLGFVNFATNILGPKIPAFLIPAVIFLIGCAASYFMGSAWGTWALIMPIAVPLAISAKVDLPLIIGAVLAEGSLGDNASPLGETAILSATVAEIPLMEHIKSQLPYSLAAVVISFVLFIVLGVMF